MLSAMKITHNKRKDFRVIRLKAYYGHYGYGLYMEILELLMENNNNLLCDYKAIAYELHCEENEIKAIIEEFDLFNIDNNHFFSELLIEDIEKKKKRSQINSENAKKRWQKAKEALTVTSDDDTKDIEIKEDKTNEKKVKVKIDRTNYDEIMQLYNDNCTKLSKVVKIPDSIKQKVRTRLKEYTIDEIKEAFKIANETPFLSGENKSGWKASFEWFFRNDKNIRNVLDGTYGKPSNNIQQPNNSKLKQNDIHVEKFDTNKDSLIEYQFETGKITAEEREKLYEKKRKQQETINRLWKELEK